MLSKIRNLLAREEVVTEPSRRDIALALLYKDIKNNCSDWVFIRFDAIQSKKLPIKRASLTNYLYNEKLNVYLCTHIHTGISSINDEINISFFEYRALFATWQTGKSIEGCEKLIKTLTGETKWQQPSIYNSSHPTHQGWVIGKSYQSPQRLDICR